MSPLHLPYPFSVGPVAAAQLITNVDVTRINVVYVIDTQPKKVAFSRAFQNRIPSRMSLFNPFNFIAAH